MKIISIKLSLAYKLASSISLIKKTILPITSANRKPALAARGLSVSYVGRPKGAKSAPSARWALRALDLGSILARWALGAEIKPVL